MEAQDKVELTIFGSISKKTSSDIKRPLILEVLKEYDPKVCLWCLSQYAV